jgi:hypothetical protein
VSLYPAYIDDRMNIGQKMSVRQPGNWKTNTCTNLNGSCLNIKELENKYSQIVQVFRVILATRGNQNVLIIKA